MKDLKRIEERLTWMDKALQLQAKEYERRLNDLNGEAGRLREMQQTYIPREIFDRSLQQQNEKFERVISDLKERIEILTAVNLKNEGIKSISAIIPWAISIGGMILVYYLNK